MEYYDINNDGVINGNDDVRIKYEYDADGKQISKKYYPPFNHYNQHYEVIYNSDDTVIRKDYQNGVLQQEVFFTVNKKVPADDNYKIEDVFIHESTRGKNIAQKQIITYENGDKTKITSVTNHYYDNNENSWKGLLIKTEEFVDIDGDGYISPDEKLQKPITTTYEYDKYDRRVGYTKENSDGSILKEKRIYEEAKLSRIENYIDTDGDGKDEKLTRLEQYQYNNDGTSFATVYENDTNGDDKINENDRISYVIHRKASGTIDGVTYYIYDTDGKLIKLETKSNILGLIYISIEDFNNANLPITSTIFLDNNGNVNKITKYSLIDDYKLQYNEYTLDTDGNGEIDEKDNPTKTINYKTHDKSQIESVVEYTYYDDNKTLKEKNWRSDTNGDGIVNENDKITKTIKYNNDGTVKSIEGYGYNENGDITRIDEYADTNNSESIDEDDNIISSTVYENGKVKSIIKYYYDEDNKLTKTREFIDRNDNNKIDDEEINGGWGLEKTTFYDKNGNVKEIAKQIFKDELDKDRNKKFEKHLRYTQDTNGDGEINEDDKPTYVYTINDEGRGITTKYTYDDHNRVVKTEEYHGIGDLSENLESLTTFDIEDSKDKEIYTKYYNVNGDETYLIHTRYYSNGKYLMYKTEFIDSDGDGKIDESKDNKVKETNYVGDNEIGSIIQYQYDNNEVREYIIDTDVNGDGKITENDKIRKIIIWDENKQDKKGEIKYAFNGNGDVSREFTDMEGKEKQIKDYFYDENKNLIRTEEFEDNNNNNNRDTEDKNTIITTYKYDTLNNLTNIEKTVYKDGDGKIDEITKYEIQNEKTIKVNHFVDLDGDGKINEEKEIFKQTEYYENGNIKTEANYTYDDKNRISRITTLIDTDGDGLFDKRRIKTFEYNNNARIGKETEENITDKRIVSNNEDNVLRKTSIGLNVGLGLDFIIKDRYILGMEYRYSEVKFKEYKVKTHNIGMKFGVQF